MLDLYKTLESDLVLQKISLYAKGERAIEEIKNLRMFSNVEELKNELEILRQFIYCIQRVGSPDISASKDIKHLVLFASKGGVLNPDEFATIKNDIEISEKMIQYSSLLPKNDFPLVADIFNAICNLDGLKQEIERVFSPNMTIKNSASHDLNKIRKQIMATENQIREKTSLLISKYKEYLTSTSLTIKNDHFVLPVKTAYKNYISGIIYDVSDSGQTTFIEPSVLIDLGNDLYILRNSEHEEIIKILSELSKHVSAYENELLGNNELIFRIDFLKAKCIYALENKATVACLVDNNEALKIVDARHPLIEEERAVRNSFILNKEQKIIIISGPNAGGKTVSLKTLGLCVLMTQMGLPILTPTESQIPYFKRIFCDIGDNQSLSDNLSTFTAHISNLSTITHFAKENDLILLDELGTGTSPFEGEALAVAITEFLRKKDCYAVISSHFEKMKEYAYVTEGVENACMLFDEVKLVPTYKLKIGIPGKSYGLDVANRCNLNKSIIYDARKIVEKNESSDVSDILDSLNKTVKEAEDNKAEAALLKASLEKEKINLEKTLEKVKKEKERLEEDYEEIKEELVKKTKKQINEIVSSFTSNAFNVSGLSDLKGKLNALLVNSKEEEIKIDESLMEGDYVYITPLETNGRIQKINGDKVTILTIDGLTVKTKMVNIKKEDEPIVEKAKAKAPTREVFGLTNNIGLELNVIGLHVDEALNEVSKYIDSAVVRNFKSVRIIHGNGSGALRNAIGNYLKTCKFVKDFHYGGWTDGGMGATIVVLKND